MIVHGRNKKDGSNDYKYVVCAKIRRIGKFACENHHKVKYDYVLNGLLDSLRSLSESPRDIEDIAQGILERVEGGRESSQARIATVKRQLAENQEQQMKNLEAFRTGLFTMELVQQGQKNLMTEAERLNAELSRLEVSEQMGQDTTKKLEEIRSALKIFKNLGEFDEMTQRIALRKLVDRIDFDGKGNVEVRYSWMI